MANGFDVEKWYKELYKLMWAMTWDVSNANRWQLEPDELFAELSAELVKVVLYYADNGREYDDEELKKIIIVSLRNRCKDLLSMTYYTHRRVEADMYALDDMLKEPGRFPAFFDFDGFMSCLSDDGVALVTEVLEPSDMLVQQVELAAMRKEAAFPKGYWRLSLTPLMLRRALGWDEERFEDAWDEVKCTLSAF